MIAVLIGGPDDGREVEVGDDPPRQINVGIPPTATAMFRDPNPNPTALRAHVYLLEPSPLGLPLTRPRYTYKGIQ